MGLRQEMAGLPKQGTSGVAPVNPVSKEPHMSRNMLLSVAGMAVVAAAAVSLVTCTEQAPPTAPAKAAPVAAVAAPLTTHSGSSVCLSYMDKHSDAQLRLDQAREKHANAAVISELQRKADRLTSIATEACN
jgi:hypothetical protein